MWNWGTVEVGRRERLVARERGEVRRKSFMVVGKERAQGEVGAGKERGYERGWSRVGCAGNIGVC